ncbi:MAG: M48 family metallopeptidase [Candidatus Marinimicrobia bacterium]|nr:M48 family metallopeptidase [Candidatus Neomarinimicrobiota bacterium]
MKHYQLQDIGDIIVRKHRKSKRLRATAKPSGEIFVTIPYYASYREALDFLLSNKDKILEIKEKIKARNIKRDQYITGRIYTTKFHQFSLDYHSGEDFRLKRKEKHFQLLLPDKMETENEKTQDIIRRVLREIYRKEAKMYLVPRSQMFAHKHGLKIRSISIKNAKTRWGSCSSKSNINLNLNLMKLPNQLIDYVILHELAHLKHPNHSAEFWQFLGTMIDNPKKHDSELKNYNLHYLAT